ncbi:hypothetical protein JCM3774_001184 [Rhodotorula dairenensis]
MAGVLPGLQAAAPTAELPAWLSYTSSAIATVEQVYTFATLLANGVPTLATTVVLQTQYGTDLLQLPITVDASAVEGQDLGQYYTTAGGATSPTVARLIGGTQEVTLGSSASGSVAAPAAVGPSSLASSSARIASDAATEQSTDPPSPSASSSTPVAISSIRSLPTSAPFASTPLRSSLPPSFGTSSSSGLSTSAVSSPSPTDTAATSATSSSASDHNITPVPSIRAPPTSANFASGLTPSQLAAAIASPICFFFAVMLLLLLGCCFVRRKRRKRAQQRALAEEEGLLDPGGGGPVASEKPQEHRAVSGGVLWEWVPRRAASRVSGRSGRSVLSRLTGGLLGGGAARSRSRSTRSRQTATPKNSPLEGEKFFGAASHASGSGASPNTASHEGASLLSPETAQTTVRSPQSEWSANPSTAGALSPEMTTSGTPAALAAAAAARRDHTSAGQQRLGEPFSDIDLTSPRLDFGAFEPLPFTNDEERLHHSPPPTLPPIRPSGAFRLTKLYNADGTDAQVYLPASPVSLGTQPRPDTVSHERSSGPMGLLRRATITLSEIWNGYDAASPLTDDGGAAFLSPRANHARGSTPWSQHPPGGDEVLPHSIATHTPPETPRTPKSNRNLHSGVKESPAPRTPSPRRKQERILSEGGWLSGRVAAYMAGEGRDSRTSLEGDEDVPVGLRQRAATGSSGGTADLTRTPESTLFLNDSRWRGRSVRAPSPPPFTSFDLVEESPVAYDPPEAGPPRRPLPPLPTTQRHSQTTASGSDSSYSRHYSDPGHPNSRFPLSSSVPRVEALGRELNRHSSESGGSVLGRIAATFGALRSKRSNSSGWEPDDGGGVVPWRRSTPSLGMSKPSRESMADPTPQHRFLPSLPPPPLTVSSPPRSRFAASTTTPGSSSLRHSASQPSLASPTRYGPDSSEPFSSSFRVSRPGSVHEGRQYLDPFEDVSEAELAFLRKFGGGAVNPPAQSSAGSQQPAGAHQQAQGQQEAHEWFTENPADRYYGLENFGNTCYANSVIQSLYFSAPFRHLVESYLPYGHEAPQPPSSPSTSTAASLHASPTIPSGPLSTSPSSPALSALSSAGKVAKAVGTAMATPYAPVPSPPTLSIRVPPGGRPTPATGGSRGAIFNPNRRSSTSSTAGPASPTMGFHGGAPLGPRTTQGSFTGVGAPIIGQNGAIVKQLTGGETTLLSTLRDLFCAISSQPRGLGTIAPQAFINQLKCDNEFFRSTLHQDAHEFFNVLINSIAETLEVEERKRAEDEGRPPSMVGTGFAAHARTWVHQLFEGILTNETRCLTCETVTSRDEAFLDLSIDIEQNTSVTACLRQFSASEMLCQRNKFSCDRCCGLQEAEKRMKVKKLPNILALHLKRFKYEESLQRHVKLTCRVVFPFELRLPNTADDIANPDRLYELWAIVVHIGVGPHHGHYITVVKSGKRWIVFDDNNVFPIEQSEIARFFGDTPGQGSGYVLFYQAVDLDWTGIDIPPPPTPSVAGTAHSRGRAHTNSSVSTGGWAMSAEHEAPPVPPLPAASISGGLANPEGPGPTPLTPNGIPIPLVDPTASIPDSVSASSQSSIHDGIGGERRDSTGGWSGLRGKFSRTKSSASAERRASISTSHGAPVFTGSEPLAAIPSRDDALAAAEDSAAVSTAPSESPTLHATTGGRGRLPSFSGGSSAPRAPSEDGSASTGSAAPTTTSSPFLPQRRRDSRPSFGAADSPAGNGHASGLPSASPGLASSATLAPGGPPSSAFAARTRSFLSRSRSEKPRPTSSHAALPPTNGLGLGLSNPSSSNGDASAASPAEVKQRLSSAPSGPAPPSDSVSLPPPPVPTPAWIPSATNGSGHAGLASSTSSLSKKDLEKRNKEEQKARDREAKERAKAEKERVKLLAKEENGPAGKLWRKMSLK